LAFHCGCHVPSFIMALISLSRSEGFSHRHDADSFTSLVSGEAVLKTDDQVIQLQPDVRVFVAAGALHEVIAQSDGVVFECHHYEQETPPS
jgi:quercetin dioxygenase-like cupin family protein